MKKRISLAICTSILTLTLLTITALAYGNNLSFPAGRRSVITKGYSGTHQALDYRMSNGTKVVAVKSGTVSSSHWGFADNEPWLCDNSEDSRGNYIILDHGGGLTTWYFHLSNTGNTPGNGTYFHQGAYMALSDNTGCSSGAHLHFALKLNGTPIDPYAGSTHWVSGAPIPMGYRDQNGNVQGPFALDDTTIRNHWLALEGVPGSPVGNDFFVPSCVLQPDNPNTSKQVQNFERGIIQYCVGSSAEYLPYAATYLPAIRGDRSTVNGWESFLAIRNDSTLLNDNSVNIYNDEGTVRDARTYKILGLNDSWTLIAEDLVFDWLVDNQTDPPLGVGFIGPSAITANYDLSASVFTRGEPGSPALAHAYTRIPSSGSYGGIAAGLTHYLPILYDHDTWKYHSTISIQNPGTVQANVTVAFRNPDGSLKYQSNPYNLSARSVQVIEVDDFGWNNFFGTAFVTSDQPVAIVVESLNSIDNIIMDYNSLAAGSTTVFLPYLMKNYSNWGSCFTVRNTSSSSTTVTPYYYPVNGSLVTGAQINLAGRASSTVCQSSINNLPNGASSARLTSTGGIPIVVIVNQDNANWGGAGNQVMSYSGINFGTTK